MAETAKNRRYTLADYLTWSEDEHIELIEGEPLMMAPPSRAHQEVSGELFRQLANFLEGKACRVYAAPFSVRLFEKDGEAPEDVDTVVEPDISVVCDRSRLDKRGCKGPPDLVIEVLSPATRRHDRLVKLGLYQRAGVREYWLADPESQSVQVMLLEDGRLTQHEDYGREDLAKVNVLSGCYIELFKVFPERSGDAE